MKSLKFVCIAALCLALSPVPPALAQDAPQAVAARVGVHPRYVSIVLHWPGEVHAEGDSDGKTGTVTFDLPGRIDLAALNDALPDNIRPARMSRDGTALSFAMPEGAELRVHNHGAMVVLDVVLPPVIHEWEMAEPPPGYTPPPKTAAAVASPAAPPPPPAATPARTAVSIALPPRPVEPAAVSAPVAAAPSPAQTPPPPSPPPTVTPSAAALPSPPAPPAIAASSPPAPPAAVKPAPEQAMVAPPPPAPPPPAELVVHRMVLDDGVSFRFDWKNPEAAAIFVRGGSAWIVFDKPQLAPADLPGLTQIANPTATVLRLAMTAADHLQIGRIGTTWMVELHRNAVAPLLAGIVPAGNFFQALSPAHPVTIADPESDGLLIAVPTGDFGQHMARTEDHGAYQALATYQGLAFQPRDDSLRIGIGPTGVTIMVANRN